VQSVGVMIASALIWKWPWMKLADPICTFIFSLLVLYTTFKLLVTSVSVLMESVPRGVEMPEVQHDLEEIPGATNVHDLHIWSLTVGKHALSCHVTSDEPADKILKLANKMLSKRHNIRHTTIQVSRTDCNHPPHSKCQY